MKPYRMSIRCYFPGRGNYTHHMTELELKDVKKWVEAYEFTHPTAEAITIKIYLKQEGKQA